MKGFVIMLIVVIAVAFLVIVIGLNAGQDLKRAYLTDVAEGIVRTRNIEPTLVTEADLAHLPDLVRNYLLYVGVVGKPKVYSMKVTFAAEMRSRTQDWFKLSVEQYSYFDKYERLFYLDATVKGLPTMGYHRYKNDFAGMKIKLLGIFPVVEAEGDMMVTAETVTMFNDMCILAPATLIDTTIQWETIDSNAVRATFTNHSTTISAILYFNAMGQLVNFISEDRYDINEKKQYPFSTPMRNFDTINGFNLPTYGEAVWHYPEGEFAYGRFTIKSLQYNCDAKVNL